MSKPQNDRGKAFENALNRSQYTPATLARALKVVPQTITHWKNRGVSSKYAKAVANYLGELEENISLQEGLSISESFENRVEYNAEVVNHSSQKSIQSEIIKYTNGEQVDKEKLLMAIYRSLTPGGKISLLGTAIKEMEAITEKQGGTGGGEGTGTLRHFPTL